MAVKYRLDEEVSVITLDRTDSYNAIDQSVTQGTVEALKRAASEARAVVLTGAGRAFCAGADLADLADEYERDGPELSDVIARRFNPIVRAILHAPMPVVAAVNGAAAGAGLGLALACDLRVMAPDAYLMSAFINVALIPDSGAAWFLPQMVGASRAMEIAMSGRKVRAEEAMALGLVHEVSDSPVETALAWAQRLADGPTEAYAATRYLIHRAASAALEATLEEEARLQGELGRRPDHLEGVKAFLEKREPRFGG